MSICRGLRGAVCAEEDSPEAIGRAVTELLTALFEANHIDRRDIASIFFTTTPDLTSAYPAVEARRCFGLENVPLLCAQEAPIAKASRRCIRILLHWNTERGQTEVEHVYLGQAGKLRPEWRWPRPVLPEES